MPWLLQGCCSVYTAQQKEQCFKANSWPFQCFAAPKLQQFPMHLLVLLLPTDRACGASPATSAPGWLSLVILCAALEKVVLLWALPYLSCSHTAVCWCLQDQMAAAQDEFGDQLTQVGSDVAKVRASLRRQQDWLQLPPGPSQGSGVLTVSSGTGCWC